MVAEQKPETIEIRHWRAVPAENGGYYIYDYRGFRGWAPNEQSARDWLNEATGVNYDNLPAVKRSELRRVETGWIPIGEFPNRGSKYKTTTYYLGEKRLGSIQVKDRNYGKRMGRRTEILTSVNNSCVLGADLRWLCKENGLRLIEE